MGRGDHKESYCTENQAAVRLFLEVLVVLQARLRGIAAQLSEGRRFNLTDTLTGKTEGLADFFKFRFVHPHAVAANLQACDRG